MNLNSNPKLKFLRTLIGGALIAGLLPVTNAFAVSTMPTSGSCAMLVTQPVPVGVTAPFNDSGYNILAVLTFISATAGTIDYYETRVDYTAGGVAMNASASETGVAFAIAPLGGTAPAAARSFTFTPSGGGGSLVANAIAVNGGNTILIQGSSVPFSGVCQF